MLRAVLRPQRLLNSREVMVTVADGVILENRVCHCASVRARERHQGARPLFEAVGERVGTLIHRPILLDSAGASLPGMFLTIREDPA